MECHKCQIFARYFFSQIYCNLSDSIIEGFIGILFQEYRKTLWRKEEVHRDDLRGRRIRKTTNTET